MRPLRPAPYSFKTVFPDPRSIRPIRLACNIDIARRAFSSATTNISISPQNLEDAWNLPAFRFNHCVTIRRQNPRQVVNETATCDVGETFDHVAWNSCQEWLIIFVHSQ